MEWIFVLLVKIFSEEFFWINVKFIVFGFNVYLLYMFLICKYNRYIIIVNVKFDELFKNVFVLFFVKLV